MKFKICVNLISFFIITFIILILTWQLKLEVYFSSKSSNYKVPDGKHSERQRYLKYWKHNNAFRSFILTESIYFRNNISGVDSGIECGSLGRLNWQLVICLTIAWILIAYWLSRGMQTSGKMIYFTVTTPYILLAFLILRGKFN